MSKWSEFYKERMVDKDYMSRFNTKYDLFLSLIENHIKQYKIPPNVTEIGCGTALVTKLLILRGCHAYFTIIDNDEDVLALADSNLRGMRHIKKQVDILSLNYLKADVVISHGFLEHLEYEEDIKQVIKTTGRAKNFHYVPLAKYKIPSFGDELLMEAKEWERITNLKALTFNHNFDCVLTRR